MQTRNRSIAVSIALVVIFAAFWGNLFPNLKDERRPSVFLEKFTALNLTPSVSNLNVAPSDPIAEQAWGVFQQYLSFAKSHDLLGVKSLSYQLSETCKNPATRSECNALMDSVYAFSREWRREDFLNIYFDERQIVMLTDAPRQDQVEAGQIPLQIALFFTRDINGTPKVLGVKFCMGDAKKTNEKCVNTDPATRDRDGNGWWDDVEARFYK